MPASSIDTILQLSPPARAAEAPARSGREGGSFGPALEQAYASGKAREGTTPARAEEKQTDDQADDLVKAEDGVGDRTETAGEKAEGVEETSGQASDDGDTSDQADEDEVEVSELANAAIAANETQAAVKAEEAAAAMQGGKAAGHEEEQQPDGGTEQASAKLNGLLPTSGDGANKEDVPGGKAIRAGKRTGDGVEPSGAGISAEKLNAEQQAKASSQSDETRAPAAESAASTDDPSANRKESAARSSKGEAAEKLQIPAIEQAAELTAAIERQVKLMDQPRTAEAATGDAAAGASTDASNSNSASQKATTTLDRLAATALRRPDESAQADGGPQIDRPRFVQRVEGALRAAQQRDGRVQVRLAPPELGVVHIELAVQNGVMTAKLEAETANARNALLDNLPALRERLAEQNICVEKFDVDVRRDPQQGGSNDAPNDRPDGHGEPNSHSRRGRTTATLTNTAPPRAVRAAESASPAGLDIRI